MPSVRTAVLSEVHVNPLLPQGSAERNAADPCRVLKMHYKDHVLISGAELLANPKAPCCTPQCLYRAAHPC